MSRGDYSEADTLAGCGIAACPTCARQAATEQLQPRQWHLRDLDLCLCVAAEHYAAADNELVAAWWSDLAARINRALRGEFARFTKNDAQLVQVEHLAVLRRRLEDDDVRHTVRARSRALSRLGVLVTEAERGRLELIR